MRALPLLLILSALSGVGQSIAAQETGGGLEARVWLDRGGEEPVLRRGENVRIYYRASEDGFAAIFRINTDGRVSLMHPQHPQDVAVMRGGRDYRLLPPDGTEWRVEEDPGMGYFFIVASPGPLDFSLFPYDRRYGWDLSAIGEAVYTDPYVAIDDYVAAIVPNWETQPYALDFLAYSVGETYSYPRFLCYDCHDYQGYSSWNPYDYNCVTYRVVIWDDPHFYPRYRYAGVNVVYAWPARALPRYEVTRRAVGDAVAPIVRVRTAAQREAAYKESPVATSPRPATAARRTASAPSSQVAASAAPRTAAAAPARRPADTSLAAAQERARAGAASEQDTARSRPTLQRRPSARLPVRTPPQARSTQPEATEPKSVTPAPSRTAPRAPITRPQREPQSAPSAAPSRGREPQAAPTPTRPSTRSTPSRPSPQPSTSARPQTAPRPSTPSAGSGSARPNRMPPATSSTPSRPRETPSARPNTPPRSAAPRSPEPRQSEPRATEPRSSAPRSSEPRPTVRSRPAEPTRPN